MLRVEPRLLSRRKPNGPDEIASLRATVHAGVGAQPGVYRMLAEDGAVLYVGKSKRLRTRLLGYFRCDPKEKGARILKHTHQITWEYTPNEFAALREELAQIKRFRPPFNVVSKRDRAHYAFVRLTAGVAPKLSVVRARTAGDGLCYGPFVGPEVVLQAVRELSDALGLRDCAEDVPMIYSNQGELIPLGRRTPGCLRYEIKKCLGPCVAGCTAMAYEERVAMARSFLEGHGDGPISRFRAEMERHSATEAYERAALYRDRLRRLSRLHEQLGTMRMALDSLSFIYPVPGFNGDDRVYLVRRGTVRAEHPAPKTTPDRLSLQRLIEDVYQPGEPAQAPIRLHEIDEILLLSSWFRRFPDELGRTWKPDTG